MQHVVSGLRTALVGRAVLRFDGPGVDGPAPLPGRVIEQVQHRSRHLQILWDDGLVLHTNLRFRGVWHLYREDELWRRPTTQLRVAIMVPGWVAACFSAPVAETYREFDRYRHPGFGRGGPDLYSPCPDVDMSVRRMTEYFEPNTPVAEVLVDPHVVCGIGNVYRSEALWACGIDPLAEIGGFDPSVCRDLLATAAELLQRNVAAVAADVPGDTRDALEVYGRNGQRCARCGDTVAVRRLGDHRRLLYWCGGCQFDNGERAHRVQQQAVEPAVQVVGEDRRHDLAG